MPKTSKIIKVAQKQRAAQIKREDAATAHLLKSWRKIAKDLRRQLKIITQQLTESIKQTGSPSATLQYEKAHIQILLDETVEQIDKYSDHVKTVTQKQVVENATRGAANAQTLAQVAVSETEATVATQWAAVNPSHIETLVDKLQPGGVFDEALQKIAPDAKQKLSDAILTRVGMGEQPESVAKDFEKALGGAAGQFTTIARTANMDAYRTSQTEFFKANNDIISGWQWMASLSFGTCTACLAMHGKYFRDDEEMESHFNCRCVPLPVVKGFESEPMQKGEDWLKSQPEDVQRKVLGPAKYDLWREGKISLNDMVAHTHHEAKGWMYREATIDQALKNAEKSGGKNESLIESSPRVSDYVINNMRDDVGQHTDDAMKAIESVHQPINFGEEKPYTKRIHQKDKHGEFKRRDGTRDAEYFGVNPESYMHEMTFVHEYGHGVHLKLFNTHLNERGYTKLESPELSGLKAALDRSDTIQSIRRELEDGGIRMEIGGKLEIIAHDDKQKNMLKYYLKDQEQFSRAYSQYIATRSKNKRMLEQINITRSLPSCERLSLWSDSEFEPIAKEFDILFRRKGLSL